MRSRSKIKGRKDTPGGFAGIPRIVMKNDDYVRLSSGARDLLLELAFQYTGKNNGDLTVAESILKKRGFKSRTTIKKSTIALIDTGMIIRTREGRFANPRGVCSLYALTWVPIDECNGKLEVNSTTTPPRKFSLEKNRNP